jgi:hypothetical protein
MTQDKSSRLNLLAQKAARARARADIPAPEITVGFSEEEAPTASLPMPLLDLLLRGTLPTAPEPPLEAVAVPVRAAAAVAVPVRAAAAVAVPASVAASAPVVAASAPVTEAPHTPPASLAAPTELEAAPTVIVVPAAAEETERIQRRRGEARSKPRRRVSLGRVTAAGLLVAAVGGAVVWRWEVADALRALAHVVGLTLA